MSPKVDGFFDETTSTASYIVSDPTTRRAAVIDPVLDYDPISGRTATDSADAMLAALETQNLTLEWVLETHVHADHLSASQYLKEKTGAKTGISAEVRTVQKAFAPLYGLESDMTLDGSEFDRLFADGEMINIGDVAIKVLATPGHTPACVTYVTEGAAFVGDTLFMPDVGTARCDFPGGDAATLYKSIQKILALPLETQLYLCHDYPSERRPEICWQTNVAAARAENIHVRDGLTEASFIETRTARDKTLGLPALLIPSVQVNMRAGALPKKDASGVCYLRTPVNVF